MDRQYRRFLANRRPPRCPCARAAHERAACGLGTLGSGSGGRLSVGGCAARSMGGGPAGPLCGQRCDPGPVWGTGRPSLRPEMRPRSGTSEQNHCGPHLAPCETHSYGSDQSSRGVMLPEKGGSNRARGGEMSPPTDRLAYATEPGGRAAAPCRPVSIRNRARGADLRPPSTGCLVGAGGGTSSHPHSCGSDQPSRGVGQLVDRQGQGQGAGTVSRF